MGERQYNKHIMATQYLYTTKALSNLQRFICTEASGLAYSSGEINLPYYHVDIIGIICARTHNPHRKTPEKILISYFF